MTGHLIYLSIPGLRPGDVTGAARKDSRTSMPTLHAWAQSGALAELTPSFPCVTSPVQASVWTGVGPGQHGVIANGFHDRDRNQVEFWMARNGIIQGEQIWDCIQRSGHLTSAVWHAQNIKDAAADYIVTPEPIHRPDGRTDLWCYSKPGGLYEQLLAELGHFPLQHYWGPLASIESSKWIIAAAQWLISRHDPNFHYIYLPHLDYASQKFGPNSPQAAEALRELDALLAGFNEFVMSSPAGPDAVFLVASEYAMTEVSSVIHPNIELRKHGLLHTREDAEGVLIDFANSRAFAMVDHQFAHVYVEQGSVDEVAAVFQAILGVDGVFAGDRRSAVAVNHPRAGEIVLVARDDCWFQYYWWADEADAPAFARTVDIHRKPGYDPVELFIDTETKGIPLDASLVKGSHGVPAIEAKHRGAIICSKPTHFIETSRTYHDTDVKSIVLGLMGIDPDRS